MFRFICISAIALTAFVCGAHARPAADDIRTDVAVPYGDLNISQEAGARALLARIEHASVRACGYSPHFRDPQSPAFFYLMQDYRRCRAEAVADAVARLRSPVVTQLFAGSAGTRPAFLAGR